MCVDSEYINNVILWYMLQHVHEHVIRCVQCGVHASQLVGSVRAEVVGEAAPALLVDRQAARR